jgi:hypothetical protein
MTVHLKVNDQFKTSGAIWVKNNGAWARVKEGWIKVDGNWQKFFIAEVKDYFDRANSATLGSTVTGQNWVAGRGVWNIASNKAYTGTPKTSYPIAWVEAGITNFTLKTNELTPGMGVAFRVEDADNWWGLVPYYNRTSYSYTECPTALEPYSYCIDPVYSTRTACSTGYRSVTTCVNGACLDWNPYYACGCAVETCGYVTTKGACYNEPRTSTTCSNVCIKNCQSCKTVVIAGGKFGLPALTTQQCTTVCCDRDYVCTTKTTYVKVCDPDTVEYKCSCTQTQYCRSCGLYEQICSSSSVCDGYEYQQTYQSGCNATGIAYRCPVAEVTRTGYNYFYNLYLIQSLNGTVTIKAQYDIGQAFTALQVEGDGTNFLINAYSSDAYTGLLKSFIYSDIDSVYGTKYGLVGYPSNYAEGNTIGSIEVKQLGA